MTVVDVVVLGLGVGGEEVAGKLAEAGLSVVGVERRLVGGECPYWGCVPSKMMIRAGNAIAEARRVDVLGGHATVRPDWAPVAKRIRDEATDDWDDTVAVDRFVGKGGHFVRGSATFTAPDTIVVGDETYTARRGIVIAGGTSAVVPPIDGLGNTPFWTNKEAIEVEVLPSSLLVLGGGSIGVELTQVFARFGVHVTVIEAADRLIAGEEPESSELADRALIADGVTIRTGVSARKISHDGGEFTVELSDGSSVTGEKLLVAVGRKANMADLGLEYAGLDPEARFIDTDERMRAGERLWAVGDIAGRGAFTHVAMYQAGIAIRDILGQDGPPADYAALPRVTFTDPEIGSVGLNESQARDKGLNVRVGLSRIPSSARGWIHKIGNEGFIKLVADADRGVLVGATSAGPTGGEVLSLLTLAIHAAVPIPVLKSMIYAYPTFHRAIEDALRDLGL
ncbi:MAG TPA: NAD(P)/FAD-dependent oxidoreductase [Micromonosporaceae bacterium]|jgi:pyruvate/2-oxoglutarate dehydrogenase complex dihydrolipoamide dehydrogenase (E3) component